MDDKKVIIASRSPVKEKAVRAGFSILFPDTPFTFESIEVKSGVSSQPTSGEEIRHGAQGRIQHARELFPDGDYYVGLEGGVEELFGDLYNYGWVVIESKIYKKGYGRTASFVLPPAIQKLMLEEGLEQSHATDKVFSKSGTKTGTGTIGPLTEDRVTYVDWYVPAVVCALVPFVREDLYPHVQT